MPSLIADVRYATRKLAREPGFAVAAIVSLSLSIGAATALFSIVNSVLLEPLPFAHPEQLVVVASTSPTGKHMPASPQDLLDYDRQSHAFEAFAQLDAGESATLTRPGASALRLSEARVGADMFRVLGVRPAMGRFFAQGEDSSAAAKVVVLSDIAWHRYFGGDPQIVGTSIILDQASYRVIGVAKPGLDYPQSPDVWVPLVWHSYELGDAARGYNAAAGVARLRDGVTLESASRSLQVIASRIAIAFPATNAKIGAFAAPLQEQLVGDVSHALWPMLGAVLLVLLIACTNVANLLLVRATARDAEMALRTALGAARRRIVAQLITESMLLWVVGAALGALAAAWALDAIVAFGPQDLPRLHEITLDGRVLAFAAALTVATGLGFGLVPALYAARANVAQLLKGVGRGSSRSAANRLRSGLVLGEVALATVLLVGAGLLIRSFQRITHVDPGFRAEHLIVLDAALPGGLYRKDADNKRFANEALSRLTALPGVQSAAVAADRPLDPDGPFTASTSFTVAGMPKPVPGTEPSSRLHPVSPSYFATVGATLVRGRFFTDAENRLDAAPVIVIDDELAKRYFPNEDPIGRRLIFGISHSVTGAPGDTVRMGGTIVGIVRHIVEAKLGEKADPATYFPYATAPFAATFVVRTHGDPTSVQSAVANVIRSVDSNVPVYELGTMEAAMSHSVGQPRFYTVLLGAFAALALLLATIGIFGVMSFMVAQRTREFGIRMALGATAKDLAGNVIGRGVGLTGLGIALGLAAAALLTKVIASMLYATNPLDFASFMVAAVALVGAAALAAWLPARRAARVDPVAAMRAE